MKRLFGVILLSEIYFTRSIVQAHSIRSMSSYKNPEIPDKVVKSDFEWRQLLDDQEFRILRKKDTERPFTGEYENVFPKKGYFACKGCGNPLYSYSSKFHSGCGWPAFDKCFENSIKIEVDRSFGMNRVEIMCAKCDGHLGHVFGGERYTQTNERHCVNSKSIVYVEQDLQVKEVQIL
jgi:peptide-methionine (R)-S-oxide reductase